ncbi:MAG TPA: sulfate adenylyltransferase [Leeuwenhoekiella sp.]|uniref:sulfate adenylyltransferase subunit 1 n=1 Tax=Leeuwenhoekiella palythoae TaxID=573501 RepID=UPI000E83AD4D|nr:GTP-binding protein [Leeuwenhoekiella palythoae]UBZ09030.1 GTP-binding protein [Leeuwenhoekiella palythoae]HAX14126.1 sulfate adenylyltransferase [Leeuwenhoekiella sp.]HBO29272.1 sulfate adenylyltransferase [Leeuwenhoekiella sp.]HCQ76472.1 sulfate adenylyltransferase [Leeuwenhoekiella sp.]|tara:strand:- start:92 stop:1336 length:1245 start_codon:yes stop_codon:yes gene_type:complete
MEVLKIATAGSVDDGKSTLIGRLLYDTKSLTDDKLEAIERNSRKKGYDYLDFSLATDGLVAEREQGITIDVAHIYFSTKKKSYIIADTPGHVEYTRNMVTGASQAQASIILIDARKGVIEQTYRHFFINNLLRVKHVIVAVNKMDLVDYDQQVFEDIKRDFEKLNAQSSYEDQEVTFVPISALKGDNVAQKSNAMPWYKGESVLDFLEALQPEQEEKTAARFPVQTVIRPKKDEFHDYRGYAGKIYGSSLKVGDAVTVLPSLTSSKIKSIEFFNEEFDEAVAGSSVTITLEDDINVTRGDILVKSDEVPQSSKTLKAAVCWMDGKALVPGAKYEIQHNTNRILAKIDSIDIVISTDYSGEDVAAGQLKLNEIGKVNFKLSKNLFYDNYADNKAGGSFILIDTQSNTTAGVGFIG